MKAFARESFFKILSEKDFNTGVFQQILEVFQNTFLIENIWPTAPEINYLNLELFLISKPYYTTTAHTILNSKTKYVYSVFFTGISYNDCPSPMFSKICTFLYFYILSHLLSFWNPSPPLSPPPSLTPHLFYHPLHSFFHKAYPHHNIPKNLQFFIFSNTFWSMFIPFLTSFQVAFSTQFQMSIGTCNNELATLSCLRLYSIYANFSHSLTL